jgi:hypothetical protein
MRRFDFRDTGLFKEAKVGFAIFVIDVLIIGGMFYFWQVHYKPSLSLHTIDGISYYLYHKKQPDSLDVKFFLRIKNKRRKDVEFEFSGAPCVFVVKKGEREVWKGKAEGVRSVYLQPKEKHVFCCVWNQRDTRGVLVEPGRYEVICFFNAEDPISIGSYIEVRK